MRSQYSESMALNGQTRDSVMTQQQQQHQQQFQYDHVLQLYGLTLSVLYELMKPSTCERIPVTDYIVSICIQ